jgi:hypothetical protein
VEEETVQHLIGVQEGDCAYLDYSGGDSVALDWSTVQIMTGMGEESA